MNSRTKFGIVTFLTFVRFPLVLLFFAGAIVYACLAHKPRDNYLAWLFYASLGSMILAAITDMFDGYLARKLNVETRMGAHADPLMDKLFYIVSLPVLLFVATKNDHLYHAIFLLIMTVFFLARDQWVTFLRSIGSMYNVSGSANWSGKLRTLVNFPLICCIYHLEEAPVQILNPWFVHSIEIIAFFINFVSIYVYTRRYWPSLNRSVHADERPSQEIP